MDFLEKTLKPGNKIELRPDEIPKSSEEDGEVKFYESKISDIREDGCVEVYMPIEHGKLVLFSIGSRMDMHCYTGNGMYECRISVKERYKKGTLYFLLLQLTSELKKKQRREYYRYQCTLPMQDRLMDITERKWMLERGQLVVMEGLPMSVSTIVDISGGGIQFTGGHKYEVNNLICGKFDFGKTYQICMQILDSSGITDRPGEYRHRAKFFGVGKKEREEIIRHIFALERQKRKSDI